MKHLPVFMAVLALLGLLSSALVGCGGDGGTGSGLGVSNTNYSFSTHTLKCNDSLNITSLKGVFQPGATVTFEDQNNPNNHFDGSAVGIMGDDTLVTGLPSNAPSGTYRVVLEDSDVNEQIGTITYTACSK